MLYYINLLIAFVCTFILIFTAGFVLYKNRGGQSPIYYAQYNLAVRELWVLSSLLIYPEFAIRLQFNRMSQVASVIFSGTLLNSPLLS
jgi:hypothetical protein